jgi:hypothetical protein
MFQVPWKRSKRSCPSSQGQTKRAVIEESFRLKLPRQDKKNNCDVIFKLDSRINQTPKMRKKLAEKVCGDF